jgi:translation elongation factor aEF-1 beta
LARVLVSLKIFPADIDVNRDALKTEIKETLPDYASIYKFEEEPIAYGLVAVIAHILVPEDRTGAVDEVESSLRKIGKISDFQTLMVRRV